MFIFCFDLLRFTSAQHINHKDGPALMILRKFEPFFELHEAFELYLYLYHFKNLSRDLYKEN